VKNKKEKLKEKLTDAVCTFLGSILALLVYYLIYGHIRKFFLGFNYFPKGFVDVIMGVIFSTLVALGFLLISFFLIWWESIIFYKKPVVDITFYNENKVKLNKLNFARTPEEPKFLKIKFETQLGVLQAKIIRLIKPVILINTNPQMCAFEFDDGFPYEINNYRIENNIINCDIMKLFGVSTVPVSTNMDFNVQLIMPANGVIKIEIVPQTSSRFLKALFKYYCKFEAKLEIKGE
jgi:hypothetical protein